MRRLFLLLPLAALLCAQDFSVKDVHTMTRLAYDCGRLDGVVEFLAGVPDIGAKKAKSLTKAKADEIGCPTVRFFMGIKPESAL